MPAAFVLAVATMLGAETLWTPGFQGYLSGTTSVRPGDILTVVIDSSSRLSFDSSSNDAKSVTLEFSGGEFGSLFSFLPAGRTASTQGVKGAHRYELASELAARVVEIDGAGKARVEGTRAVSVQGREEQLTVSGWLDPNALGAARQVHFSRLSDSRLSFRTFVQPASAILTAQDIEEALAALQRAPDLAPVGLPPAPAPPGVPAAPAGIEGEGVAGAEAPAAVFTLAEAKRIELFLLYVNRLVDILFQ